MQNSKNKSKKICNSILVDHESIESFSWFFFKSIASFCLILHNQPSVSHNQVCLSCLINKSFKGCLVFFFLITHHSSLNFHYSSLITHHLKYPNSLNPTHLASITQLCFQQKKPKKLGPTHWPNVIKLFSLLFFFLFPLTLIFLCLSPSFFSAFLFVFPLLFFAFIFIHVNTYFNQAHHDHYFYAFPKSKT